MALVLLYACVIGLALPVLGVCCHFRLPDIFSLGRGHTHFFTFFSLFFTRPKKK